MLGRYFPIEWTSPSRPNPTITTCLQVGVDVGHREGGVPGLDRRNHLVFPTNVEVGGVPLTVGGHEGSSVGHIGGTSEAARFSTLYLPLPGWPMPAVSRLLVTPQAHWVGLIIRVDFEPLALEHRLHVHPGNCFRRLSRRDGSVGRVGLHREW